MVNLFEQFVQIELPKRPYIETDVAQETVIIRRGQAPRQLGAVDLEDDEVLGKVDGQLAGIPLAEISGARHLRHDQEQAATEWVIPKADPTTSVLVIVYDAESEQVYPDSVFVGDTVVQIKFFEAQTGYALVILL